MMQCSSSRYASFTKVTRTPTLEVSSHLGPKANLTLTQSPNPELNHNSWERVCYKYHENQAHLSDLDAKFNGQNVSDIQLRPV